MTYPKLIRIACLAVTLGACGASPPADEVATVAESSGVIPRSIQPDPRETHFTELRMLTDGGENAEAYFSFAGDRLVFQSTRAPWSCDQILSMKLDGSDVQLVSTGRGRTTCAYFYPDDQWIVYASTHLGGNDCPPVPDHSQGYVWPLYADYDLFRVRVGGGDPERLTDTRGYDAEATISPTGDRIVFTSMRDGDLDIYTMTLDGSDVVRLTDELGYDGGPFFSPDGEKIVYRAYHPTSDAEVNDYTSLLAQGMIRPSKLEIWTMNADGSDKQQITDLGVAAFAPFFHPSGDKIIFSSNLGDPTGREFELFMVPAQGGDVEQITFSPGFDGFPMWAPDGETFVFCSNRANSKAGETNVFVTTWVD